MTSVATGAIPMVIGGRFRIQEVESRTFVRRHHVTLGGRRRRSKRRRKTKIRKKKKGAAKKKEKKNYNTEGKTEELNLDGCYCLFYFSTKENYA